MASDLSRQTSFMMPKSPHGLKHRVTGATTPTVVSPSSAPNTMSPTTAPRNKRRSIKPGSVFVIDKLPMDVGESYREAQPMLQKVCKKNEISCYIPVKYINGASSSSVQVEYEYLILAKKPFKTGRRDGRIILTKGGPYQQYRVQKWKLSSLREFNELASVDVGEGTAWPFVLVLADKVTLEHSHVFVTAEEKTRTKFLSKLYELCHTQLSAMPSTSFECVTASPLDSNISFSKLGQGEFDSLHAFSSLAHMEMESAEELKIMELMGGADVTADFDAVYAGLSAELDALESENIALLLTAQSQVRNDLLPEAMRVQDKLGGMETWLDGFDTTLRDVRRYIAHFEERNNRMETVAKNQRSLSTLLSDIVTQLSFDDADEILKTADLSSEEALPRIIEAANTLRGIVTRKFDPKILHLSSVQAQLKKAKDVVANFTEVLRSFLIESIKKMKKDAPGTLKTIVKDRKKPDSLSPLSVPRAFHLRLANYVPLIAWLKDIDPQSHTAILETYTDNFCIIYKQSFSAYFKDLNNRIVDEPREHAEILSSLLFSDSSRKVGTSWLNRMKNVINEGRTCAGRKNEDFTVDRACMSACREVFNIVGEEINWRSETFGCNPAQDIDIGNMLGTEYRNDLSELIVKAFKSDPFYMLESLASIESAKQNSSASSAGERNIILEGESFFIEQACQKNFSTFIDKQEELLAKSQVSLGNVSVSPNFFKLPYVIFFMDSARRRCMGPKAEPGSFPALSSLIDLNSTKLINAFSNVVKNIPSKSGQTVAHVARVVNLSHVCTALHKKLGADYHSLTKVLGDLDTELERAQKSMSNYLLMKHFNDLLSFFKEVKELTMTVTAKEVKYQARFSVQAALAVVGKYGPPVLEKTFPKILHALVKKLSSENRHPAAVLRILWRAFVDNFIEKYSSIEELMKECYEAKMLMPKQALEYLISGVWEAYSQQFTGTSHADSDNESGLDDDSVGD